MKLLAGVAITVVLAWWTMPSAGIADPLKPASRPVNNIGQLDHHLQRMREILERRKHLHSQMSAPGVSSEKKSQLGEEFARLGAELESHLDAFVGVARRSLGEAARASVSGGRSVCAWRKDTIMTRLRDRSAWIEGASLSAGQSVYSAETVVRLLHERVTATCPGGGQLKVVVHWTNGAMIVDRVFCTAHDGDQN